jgi:Lrp/AsnC family leucine-responsive transcriptional regulator
MSAGPLDPLDSAIVRELVADGRASYQELGRRIGLSATATADRVRRLQRDGVIVGFRALVDPEQLGRNVEATIDIRLEPGADRTRLAEVLRAHPAVIEAIHVTGTYDYVLRVFCTGTAELDALLGVMKRDGGVVESQTRLLLHRIDGLSDIGASYATQPPRPGTYPGF